MERRKFIKILAAGITGLTFFPIFKYSENNLHAAVFLQINGEYFKKMKNFAQPDADDIYLKLSQKNILKSVLKRLNRIQTQIGYSNFCLLNFDEALKTAYGYTTIGSFTKQEIDFLEMLFYNDAKIYGFYGAKPLNNITGKIDASKAIKIKNTGNFVYNGLALETYNKILKDIGGDVILISGIRGIVKQFYLFLNKLKRSGGNLSLSSRSLAPPGYSYHGIGDFDVGKSGYGVLNFTNDFTKTDVYKKLVKLGYINFRYPQNNRLGVRFEPWHIKLKN
ncbi:MAG: M15 family metallopeptidase [Deltaproteobacteria bacterium]|nr:M15 family metallopeptidase [Deltaproteobacteria bacterium]